MECHTLSGRKRIKSLEALPDRLAALRIGALALLALVFGCTRYAAYEPVPLPSILMTAMVTALAMLPIAVDSDNPGREIMGPMAVIIIGGLCSSALLNLLLLPALMLRYGRPGGARFN